MYIKPNMYSEYEETKQKNDLFRKFKECFICATEREFRRFSFYSKEGYISVNRALEERIFDVLHFKTDEILPITGATGIGKTYLLLYCLKTYYCVDDIPTNHPQIYKTGNDSDLVYCSDFNITEKSILENPTDLCLSKIKAMNECLTKEFNIEDVDVDTYILENKLEVNFYSEYNYCYQKELYRLISILNLEKTKLNSIVFIFDDLESLTEKQQFTLMENFLKLFENLKSKADSKVNFKFIFCLRDSTYFNMYKKDFYNTHRANKAIRLTVAPSLYQLLEKRFDLILASKGIKQSKKEENWKKAKGILLSIANRVDLNYTNILMALNNNNISNALDDFLSIITNRRWTQKNVNPAASFVIEENDYYINDTNILRILSIGERNIYYQSMSMPIRCILPSPGVSYEEDLFAFLILRAFRINSNPFGVADISKLFSVSDLAYLIGDLISDKQSFLVRAQIERIVEKAFLYYEENRFIKKNIDPTTTKESDKYYMLPRGEQIFDLFFSQTILFNIFRDAFIWDSQKFNVKCSNCLSFEELVIESITYEKELIKVERRFFDKITSNKMWRQYFSYFETWSTSESFFKAINKTIHQYYKNENMIPANILEELDIIQKDVSNLVSTFDSIHEEHSFF